MSWSTKGVDQTTKLRGYWENGGKICDLLEIQHQKKYKSEQIEKQNQWAQQVRHAQGASDYAEVFTCSIPGIERRQLKWMRDVLEHNYRISS